MICPGCHFMDDRMPNCLVCGGRGVLEDDSSADLAALRDQQIGAREGAEGAKEEKADTDCTDSTDGKKEVKVKTFVKRLKKVHRLLVEDTAARFNGADLDDLATAQEVFRRHATQFKSLALESRILYLLVQTLVLMACKAPQRSGTSHLERKRDVLAQLPPVLELLKQKNASYGDTALNPKRYFATGSALDMLLVRIDDKLNRIFTAADAFGEDALLDLAGYLVLAYLAIEDEWDAAVRAGPYCPTHRLPWHRCGCVPVNILKQKETKAAKELKADSDGKSTCPTCGVRPCAQGWSPCQQCLDQGLMY